MKKLIIVLGFLAVLILIVIVIDFKEMPQPMPEPKVEKETFGETIIIDAAQGQYRQLMQGFLHGFDEGRVNPIPKPELVAALKPKFWRTSEGGNALLRYITVKQFNPKITWETSETYYKLKSTWYNECGSDFQGCSDCGKAPKPPQPWLDNFAEYKTLIRTYITAFLQNNLSIDYWDWWSEPDNYGRFGTQEQMFNTFKAFHDAVREVEKETGKAIKIVAPSIANIEGKDWQENNDCNLPAKPADQRTFRLEDFLQFVADNNLKLDAVSWHHMPMPDELPQQTAIIRDFMKQIGLCNPGCPEIHINEYQGYEHNLLPGTAAGFIYYLEQANVDWASRSCWKVGDVHTCWGGMGGVFLQDTQTPQALYWLFKVYADMDQKLRLPVQANDSHTVVLASRDDETKEIRILAGRYCHYGNKTWSDCYNPVLKKGPASDVAIVLNNYSYGNSAQVEIYKIPNNNNIPKKLAAPLFVSSQVLSVVDKKIRIIIENFEDQDAYEIIIRQ